MSVSLETLALAKKAIAKAIGDMGGAGGITYSIVNELPLSGSAGIIYLLPREDEDNQDLYEEYIWVNDSFERIPWKTVDLSDYAKVRSLTYAEYQALSDAEKNNGTYYAITDLSNVPDGTNIDY